MQAYARALVGLLVIAALAACDVLAPTQVDVTLQIYSGRPDPSWTVDGGAAAGVASAIGALPQPIAGQPEDGGLGYHGFLVVVHRDGRPDETFVAYRGRVEPIGTGERMFRNDAGRTIERRLLETGRSVLAPAEIAAVEADLAIGP